MKISSFYQTKSKKLELKTVFSLNKKPNTWVFIIKKIINSLKKFLTTKYFFNFNTNISKKRIFTKF